MPRSKFVAAALWCAAAFTLPSAAAPTYHYTTIDVPGAVETQAYGIDDSGRIVGAYRDAAGTWRGFVASGGSVTPIVYPGAAYTDAVGIAPTGAVAGSASPVPQPGGNDFVHGYVLAGGVYTPLVVPGATATGAFGINGAGAVVGGYIVEGGGTRRHHGALWTGGLLTTIDVAGADDTTANGINELGQIVGGYSSDCAGCAAGGFLWSAGAVTPIVPFGAARSGAFGLNDLGAVVGWFGEGDGLTGYLWDDGAFHVIEPPGARYGEAVDINNRGAVVGSYADAAGAIHGFLATPQAVPLAAPGAAALSALGLVLAAVFRRRRRRVGAGGAPAALIASCLLALALPSRAAPVLDYWYSAFVSLDAGQSHWHTNVQRTGSEAGSGLIGQGVTDNHLGGAQAALTSAYAEVGALGGKVYASTAGALLASAQGFNDLSWYTDFLVTGTPGTKVSYLFGTALDGSTAFGGLPFGTYSGGVGSTTFVGGQLLADWRFDVLVDPGPFDVWAIQRYEFDVGTVVRLSSRLTVGAHADVESSVEADAFNTSRFFVDVLTPGGGYVTGGNVVFPTLPAAGIPEPASALLLATGLIVAAWPLRRRRPC